MRGPPPMSSLMWAVCLSFGQPCLTPPQLPYAELYPTTIYHGVPYPLGRIPFFKWLQVNISTLGCPVVPWHPGTLAMPSARNTLIPWKAWPSAPHVTGYISFLKNTLGTGPLCPITSAKLYQDSAVPIILCKHVRLTATLMQRSLHTKSFHNHTCLSVLNTRIV